MLIAEIKAVIWAVLEAVLGWIGMEKGEEWAKRGWRACQ